MLVVNLVQKKVSIHESLAVKAAGLTTQRGPRDLICSKRGDVYSDEGRPPKKRDQEAQEDPPAVYAPARQGFSLDPPVSCFRHLTPQDVM